MTEAIIQIQNLEKRFRSKNTEVYALQGINLTIRKGDIFGIIGKSGAGKSTLVRCIRPPQPSTPPPRNPSFR